MTLTNKIRDQKIQTAGQIKVKHVGDPFTLTPSRNQTNHINRKKGDTVNHLEHSYLTKYTPAASTGALQAQTKSMRRKDKLWGERS